MGISRIWIISVLVVLIALVSFFNAVLAQICWKSYFFLLSVFVFG